eukprot:73512-Alexandrium_andersonii.AAC.1
MSFAAWRTLNRLAICRCAASGARMCLSGWSRRQALRYRCRTFASRARPHSPLAIPQNSGRSPGSVE